jgi:bacteriorhodopsin
MNAKLSTFLGFIPFTIMFYIIYDNYSKYTSVGIKTFIFFVVVWSLYAVAALMNYKIKNIMYNILDLFSKNYFAIFLAYILFKIVTDPKYLPNDDNKDINIFDLLFIFFKKL